MLEKSCPGLEQLNLSGTALTQIENPDLPQLQKLTVSHCWQLNRIQSDSIIERRFRDDRNATSNAGAPFFEGRSLFQVD